MDAPSYKRVLCQDVKTTQILQETIPAEPLVDPPPVNYVIFFIPGINTSIFTYKIGTTPQTTALQTSTVHQPLATFVTQFTDPPDPIETGFRIETEHRFWKGVNYKLELTSVASNWDLAGYIEIADIPLRAIHAYTETRFDNQPQQIHIDPYYVSDYAITPTEDYANHIHQLDISNLNSYEFKSLKSLNTLNINLNTDLLKNFTELSTEYNYENLASFQIIIDHLIDRFTVPKILKIQINRYHKLNIVATNTIETIPKETSYINVFST